MDAVFKYRLSSPRIISTWKSQYKEDDSEVQLVETKKHTLMLNQKKNRVD